MSKIYAVKIGRKKGLFNNWEECKLSVNGFPGAIYKSFNNELEAINFLNSELEHTKEYNKTNINLEIENDIQKELDNQYAVIFLDGSYDKQIQKYSYGSYILIKQNNIINNYELYQSYDDIRYLDSRNVSGEIFGVIESLKWCISKNIKKS